MSRVSALEDWWTGGLWSQWFEGGKDTYETKVICPDYISTTTHLLPCMAGPLPPGVNARCMASFGSVVTYVSYYVYTPVWAQGSTRVFEPKRQVGACYTREWFTIGAWRSHSQPCAIVCVYKSHKTRNSTRWPCDVLPNKQPFIGISSRQQLAHSNDLQSLWFLGEQAAATWLQTTG
jgi:hypothetical protein